MPENRTLLLTCESVEFTDTDIARYNDASAGRYLWCAVTDTGQPMEASVRERIFEPFLITKKIGAATGLGLSVTRTIASDFDGFITVESDLDVETCLSVFIPLALDSNDTKNQPRKKSRKGNHSCAQ